MAAPGEYKANFTAGEFAPEMAGRIDVKAWYGGASRMKNAFPVLQGGFDLAPGSRLIGPARRPLAILPVTGATTAPGPHSGSAVVWQGTVAGIVSAVELAGLTTTAAASVAVDVLTPAGWRQLGGAFPADGTPRTRLAAAPPGLGIAGTAVRVRMTAPTAAAVSALSVTPFTETGGAVAPAMIRLRETADDAFMLLVSPGMVDVYRGIAYAGGVRVPAVTAEMLATLGHYAEARTVGLFHWNLRSQRLRRFSADHDWGVDDWPYDGMPLVEYDGVYQRIADAWEIFLNWSTTNTALSVLIIVDGETTPAVDLGTPGPAINVGVATEANWTAFAGALQAALRALPSLGPGVTVTQQPASDRRKLRIVFDGALAGAQYDVSAQIPNTSQASALPSHVVIGETIGEPAASATRGWPRTAALIQDRMAYGGLKARRAAMMLSAAGEYFDVDIRARKDSSARLDAIRSQSAEEIRAVVDSKYLIAFTDQAVYFAPNRTISRNDPLNFVKTTSKGVGIADGTDVVDIDDQLYFIGTGGSIVYTAQYNDVTTSYAASPASLRASHLVQNVIRTTQQAPDDASDASRMWMLRADGRLVAAVIVVAEEMMFGCAEWVPAAGDPVRAIRTDADNAVWAAITRGGALWLERLEPGLLLQAAVAAVADAGGVVRGLGHLEGRTVWAVSGAGGIEGPLVVAGASVVLPAFAGQTVTVGLWEPPVVETLPMIRMVADNTILRRPGRIHTARVDVRDTTSIAVGANGEPAFDVELLRVTDPLGAPPPGRDEILAVDGLLGAVEGPTLTITQTRPGRLRVRNVTMEAVL